MKSPDTLLPYQSKWIADKSPIKIMEKSRCIGISWAEAADCALLASKAEGHDVYYVGCDDNASRLWMEYVAWWVSHYQLSASPCEQITIKDDGEDILTHQISFTFGYKITAFSSRPSNLRGKQGKVVIDGAAFHPSLSELLKAAIAFLMWGGSISIISTHNGADNLFCKLIKQVKAGKKDCSLHRVTIDDALADGLFKLVCSKQGIDWTQQLEDDWRSKLFANYGEDANEELLCIPRPSNTIGFSLLKS